MKTTIDIPEEEMEQLPATLGEHKKERGAGSGGRF
jgi:hypothetical protein